VQVRQGADVRQLVASILRRAGDCSMTRLVWEGIAADADDTALNAAQSITFRHQTAPLVPPTPTGGAICLQSIAQSLDDLRIIRLQVPGLTRIRLKVEQLNGR
jgi:hypothetical protein